MTGRRHFGSIRKLPSGRYQATYRHRGIEYKAPTTFISKVRAQACLAQIEADLHRGDWIDPRGGKVSLAEYADTWLKNRHDLRATTRAKYRSLLDLHIEPVLGQVTLSALTPSQVRDWHAGLASKHPSTAASAYRLLSAICNTAAGDDLVGRSPCRVKGGGTERANPRPTISIPEFTVAVASAEDRFRAALSLAAWCQLRRSEILGLRRCDIDLADPAEPTVNVERRIAATPDGQIDVGPPKTRAGIRKIVIPAHIVGDLKDHLDRFVRPESDASLFAQPDGNPVLPRILSRAWERARKAIGRTDVTLHDLRHTGLTLAAAGGATVAELMHRGGHASPAAAIRYQHATRQRDKVLADALSQLATSAAVVPISQGKRQTKPVSRKVARMSHETRKKQALPARSGS